MHKKHVLITGASRGIGAACAFTFAAHGYHVFLNCNKSIDALQKVADSITQQGGTCTLVPGDVGNPDTVRAIFEKISTITPGLDVLINNAGISYVGLLTDMSDEEWTRILNTNLFFIVPVLQFLTWSGKKRERLSTFPLCGEESELPAKPPILPQRLG